MATFRVVAQGRFRQNCAMIKCAPILRLLALLTGLAVTPALAYNKNEISALLGPKFEFRLCTLQISFTCYST